MKTYTKNSFLAAVLIALVSLTMGKVALADDTDIYVNGFTTANTPLVMFALDWRSNLGSVICNFTKGGTDTDIANDCSASGSGWTLSFVQDYIAPNLSAYNRAAGVIDLFTLLRACLDQAMSSLDGLRIGLMLPHNNDCTGGTKSGPTLTGCSNGGYIASGFKYMEADDANGNKAAFYKLLSAIPDPQSNDTTQTSTPASHPYQGKEMYFELYRYLTGQGIYNGHLGWDDFGDTDSTNNLNGTDATGAISLENPNHTAISWDPSIESGTNYITPFTSEMKCAKIYVVNVAFGVTNNDDDSNAAISDTNKNGGMDGLILKGTSNDFTTVIDWMHKTPIADGNHGTAPNLGDQTYVTSFFLTDKVNTTTNDYAFYGGTGNAIALGSDPTTMTNTIKTLFSLILSTSTTFVSASVPVNVFNRAENLKDVYLALFEAEEHGYPYWVGNMKKFTLQTDANTGDLFIGDKNGNPAFAADGRINYNALTYWTDANGADVLAATTPEISGYDGRSITRGGAGQQIPGFLSSSPGTTNSSGGRTIYTEPSSYTNGANSKTGTALIDLNADSTGTNATNLWNELNADGVASSGSTLNDTAWAKDSSGATVTSYSSASATQQTEARNILYWLRGYDVNSSSTFSSTTTPTRPWLMGDPIHSRPLPINYGITGTANTADNPDVRIIIGGNDGAIHMIQNIDNNTGNQSGKENWSFIPRYALHIQDRLMNDGISSPLHPYGVDGAPVLYTDDVNNDGNIINPTNDPTGDKAIVYFGMRRGGRRYYALNVTNPNSPRILWSIDNNSTGFGELGLTFSTPKVAHISYTVGTTTYSDQPVLVFAGGYDTNKDTRSTSTGTNDSMGRAVYIVDALNGNLIWKATYGSSTQSVSETEYDNADMLDSIPSAVTVLDSDGDGLIDRIYVGDTGGQIWRLDVAGTNRLLWTARVFASVGRHDKNGKVNDRRFFHAVDVVQTRDTNYPNKPYDAVIVGSGDRANPLDVSVGTNIPDNWLYMFKDRDIVSGTTTFTTPLYTNSTSTSTTTSSSNAQLADLTDDCMQYSNCSATTVTAVNNYGWMIDMKQTPGEKILSAPITIYGVIYFTTYLPPDMSSASYSCKPSEGNGSEYAVNLADATAVNNWDLTNTTVDATGNVQELGATDRYMNIGYGIPSDIIAIRINGVVHAVTTGQNQPPSLSSNNGYKTFWYTEGE